jgi:hypothetical protein
MRRTECGIFSMKMKARERARESERVSERAREAERVRERERESVDGTAADPRSCVIIELIINRGLS